MSAAIELTPVPASNPDSEEILSRGEREATRNEARVAKQAVKLLRIAAALDRRLCCLKAEAPAPWEAEKSDSARAFADAVATLSVPALDFGPEREEAIAARWAALDARSRALDTMQKAVDRFGDQLSVLGDAIAAREQEAGGVNEAIEEVRAEAAIPVQAIPFAPPPAPAEPDAAADGTERRQSKRVPVQAAVTFESDANFYTGFCNDLSDGGVFIATIDVLPRGTVIDLSLHLPSGERLSVQGEVRWHREYNELSPDLHPGMGIQFVNLDDEQRATVRAFLAERDPMFYAD